MGHWYHMSHCGMLMQHVHVYADDHVHVCVCMCVIRSVSGSRRLIGAFCRRCGGWSLWWSCAYPCGCPVSWCAGHWQSQKRRGLVIKNIWFNIDMLYILNLIHLIYDPTLIQHRYAIHIESNTSDIWSYKTSLHVDSSVWKQDGVQSISMKKYCMFVHKPRGEMGHMCHSVHYMLTK